jgi:hypothetical protein
MERRKLRESVGNLDWRSDWEHEWAQHPILSTSAERLNDDIFEALEVSETGGLIFCLLPLTFQNDASIRL